MRRVVPVILAIVAAGLLAAWLRTSPAFDLSKRLPGPPRPPPPLVGGEGKLIAYTAGGVSPEGVPPGVWPWFRGPQRDNISRDGTPLVRSWPEEGPPVLWEKRLGEGYAAPAVRDGRVYLLDYDPPGTWHFIPERGDVADWSALAGDIAGAAESDAPSPARRVWDRLPDDAREAVRRIAAGEAPEDDRRAAIAGLNRLIDQRDFYDETYFPELSKRMGGEARRLLGNIRLPGAEDAHGAKNRGNPREVRRFNRILFDATWQEAIRPARHGDVLRCFSLRDGRDLWWYAYPVKVKRFHGMSRTVPAVTETSVVSLGPKCHVVCLDAETGEFRWTIDLVAEYGTEVPQWYAGQCPLVDGDRVILAPCGNNERIPEAYRKAGARSTPVPEEDILMMAVDLETGRPVWTTPNAAGWEMSHASVVPMEVAGTRMYVYAGGVEPNGGVVGVSAETGEILWQTDAWEVPYATVPSPVPLGDGRVFLAAGYGAGCMMLRVREQDGRFTVEKVFEAEPKVYDAAQHTPIYRNGRLLSVLSSRGGPLRGQLVAMDADGKHIWSSGSDYRFGLGPFMLADGLILALDDHGKLVMAEAGADEFRPLASYQIWPDGHEAWGCLALVGGRLLVRDYEHMVCLDLRTAGE